MTVRASRPTLLTTHGMADELLPDNFTRLLTAAANHDARAAEAVLTAVYDTLKRLASHEMAGERRDHTLSATALVHEMYVALMKPPAAAKVDRAAIPSTPWTDRAHFFRAAAQVMRNLLVDHARARGRQKRGGGRRRMDLDDMNTTRAMDEADPADLMSLGDALDALAGEYPEAGQVTWLKFYAGLNGDDIGRTLGMSEETVKRRWKFARAYLLNRLHD